MNFFKSNPKIANLLTALLLAIFLVTLYSLCNFISVEVHLSHSMIFFSSALGFVGFVVTFSLLRIKYKTPTWLAMLSGIITWYIVMLSSLNILYGIPLTWLLGL